MTDHRQLLEIFFAKASDIWLHNIKQFSDNGRDATEMSRTRCAFEHVREPWHFNKGLLIQPLWVHGFGCRR
ncbi:Uncharacterised protein [Vibrio cholerae]|nr:Uncharacterised protein [Vibrio cholerae]CSD75710.1 Uncharacterised protein [Vibrio cholerae]